jgi:hypothetical protein
MSEHRRGKEKPIRYLKTAIFKNSIPFYSIKSGIPPGLLNKIGGMNSCGMASSGPQRPGPPGSNKQLWTLSEKGICKIRRALAIDYSRGAAG